MSKVKINKPNVDTAKTVTTTDYIENVYGNPVSYGYLSRYQNIPTVYDVDVQAFVHSSFYNFKISTTNNDILSIAKEGDRLDILADKYYGNATFWWVIAVASNITDPFNIVSGQLIRIPPLSSIQTAGSILGSGS